jgi:muramoyltetrapeptide carboxypeptidase
MDQDTLTAIVASRRELDGMPVVSGASFGHTAPQFTFPIGGYGSLRAEEGTAWLSIEVH